MGHRCLIGTITVTDAYAARWLHWGGPPTVVVPTLRQLWRATFGGDTAALAAALLDHDWSRLHPDPVADRPGLLTVACLGYAYPDSETAPPCRGAVTTAVAPEGLEYAYLLDTTTDTVVVYAATRRGGWLQDSVHPLAEPHPPVAPMPRCLVGVVAADGHTFVATALHDATTPPCWDPVGSLTAADGDPSQVIDRLRHLWRHRFGGDTAAFAAQLPRRVWDSRNSWTYEPRPQPAGAPTTLPLLRGDLYTPCAPRHTRWLYLLDPRTAHLLIHLSVTDGWWIGHDRQPLDPADPSHATGRHWPSHPTRTGTTP